MTPIDRLIAEQDIARLIIRFGLLNDSGDWAGVSAMFTDDAKFIRPAGGDPVMGREAIHASFASRPRASPATSSPTSWSMSPPPTPRRRARRSCSSPRRPALPKPVRPL